MYTRYLINRLLSVHLHNNGVCSAQSEGWIKEKKIFVTALERTTHIHTHQTGSTATAGPHAHNIFQYVYRGSSPCNNNNNNNDMYAAAAIVYRSCVC